MNIELDRFSDFGGDETTRAGKRSAGGWVPPPLEPAMDHDEAATAERAVEWAASGMPTMGGSK